MAEAFPLSEAQMRCIEPYFPLSHGRPRVDDRRVLSGTVYVISNGLMWRDAPAAYGRTRPCTTGSYGEAAWTCSAASSQG